jgi:hypothetical protein
MRRMVPSVETGADHMSVTMRKQQYMGQFVIDPGLFTKLVYEGEEF